MPLPFSWPGKKEGAEAASASKLEFPESLPAHGPPPLGGKTGGNPPAARSAGPVDLQELAARYDKLRLLLEQANQQVLQYLMERQSQAAAADAPLEGLAKKLDACVTKIEVMAVGSAGTMAEKLDALSGKLDRLGAAPHAVPVAAPGGGAAAAAAAPAAAAPSEASLRAALQPLQEKLDQFDVRFKALQEKAAAIDALKEAFVPTLVKVRDGLSEQHAALGGGIRQVQQQFDEGLRALDVTLQAILAHLQPPAPVAAPAPEPAGAQFSLPAGAADWEEAILGPRLANERGLEAPRQRLLSGVIQGEPAACALAGQLLVFRSAPPERMPALLKEIGEAYYRWSPQSGGRDDDMEQALVAALQRSCEEAGVTNTIELVHPGERFDAARHNASERGVEITAVHGWIVLRDNGKVYTKASVAVK